MIDENNQTGLEIAVIGMSGRFPGAKDIHEFWNNLRNGVESITFFSTQELEETQVSPEKLENPGYVKARGILEGIEYFDAVFFGYTPREAELMDPQVRMFHEVAWEALEDAGYDPYSYEGLIGFYAGAALNHYWEGLTRFSGKSAEVGKWTSNQLVDKDYMAMRISYALNLIGPSFSMYTACSTSLVAIHLACQAILNGECDLALAGGITLMLPQKTGYIYQEGMIMSPEGHCRAFDADAKGTITGSGAGIVLLKRLEDAAADRDHIYALVKGSAINNDGIRKSGFTAPSIEGQVEVIREALDLAHVEPESIGFVETHGTGTELGDPIEIKALTLAFAAPGRNFCALGAVKTNIGHLDAAAGVAGFIKTVLALTHRLIPPTLHFENPNPKIGFENSPFYVNTVPREWKNQQYPLRAGVSSFGIGGTNAHVVLEEAPVIGHSSLVTGETGKEPDYRLILLSAKTAPALEQMTQNLGLHLKNNPGIDLADAAYTLQVGRKALEYRRMLVCTNIEEAAAGLTALESGGMQTTRAASQDERNVIFMFPGQGAQYVDMGLDLYKTEQVFQEEMNRCFEIVNGLLDYDLKEILYPGEPGNRSYRSDESYIPDINQTEIAQPVLFIFEYALAKLLMHWGIEPYAMMGHSIGEYTAACLSGVFSLEDALTVVVSRGKFMQQMPSGAMLSVFVPEDQLKPLLDKNSSVSLAAVNGPGVCVVSGTHEAIDQFDLQAKTMEYETRRLHTSHAFHSAMMEPILPRFAQVVGRMSLNKPKIPYISNLTGHWQAVEQAVDPGYWTAHLRQPVRFADGISLLAKLKYPILVEVGPGQALSTFVRQYKQKEPEAAPPVINLVRHPQEEKSDTCFLLDRIGGLWLYGCKIDWKEFYRDENRRRIPLPTYPFQGQPYWINKKSLTLLPGKTPGKSLSEKKPDIGDWFYIPSWKRSLLPTHPSGSSPDRSLPGNDSHWLLFMDACGLGEQLARRLAKDNTVTLVKPGPGFARIHTKQDRQEAQYTVNPAIPGDYDALLHELRSSSQFPRRIVHLWNVTASGAESLNNDDSEITSFFSLLHLVQAIGKQDQDNKINLAVVTSSMQEATGEEILNPQKAVILGPLMVTPHEYPNIDCCAIDIVTPEPGSKKEKKLVDQLAAELTSHFPDKIIAFRGNYRLVQTFEPVHPGPGEDKVPCLRDKGVYLITGGWGGIGLEMAGYLAQTCRARLVLVGRSVFPARKEWDHWLSIHPEPDRLSRKILKIKALEQAGAEVLLLSADAADYQQMQQVIDRAETCFGMINGVIHAAGVPGGGMIQLKKTDTAKQVLAPKVKGTLVLDRLFNTKSLDFFLLCSSINSVLPRLGQVDYYAANAFMDAYAHYKTSNSGTFTVSINWDTWQQVGMAKEAAFRGLGARETGHPLLESHINDEPGVDAFLTRLSFNRHWVLNEHMTSDKKGLLPGTAYLEMVRAAFSSTAVEVETGIELRDVQFLTPLVVPEGEETDAALILKKQEKGFDFQVVSRSPGKVNGQSLRRTHAVGKVSAVDNRQGQALKMHDIKHIKALCNQGEHTREQKGYRQSRQTGFLVFGPRWGTIKRVNYGKNQALAYLELDETYTGDLQWYKLHPSLLDGAAAFLCKYINNTSAYIPFAYKRLTLVKDLPPRIFSYSRWLENNNPGQEFLTFNIILMDEKGVELAEIEEFTMMEVTQSVKERVLGAISRTTGSAAEAPGGNDSGGIETGIFDRWDQSLEFLQRGLQPAEGIEVLKRILAFPALMPQVVISTVDLEARIKAGAAGTRELAARRLTKTNKPSRPTNPRPEIRSVYVAPENETERLIAGLWQDSLGIDKIGINDDFFELGGDSLKALSVGGRIHKTSNVNVPLAEFFNRPTIKQLAQYITSHAENVPLPEIFRTANIRGLAQFITSGEQGWYTSIAASEKREYYPLSSAQSRFYILQQIAPGSTAYNIPSINKVIGTLAIEEIEGVLQNIIHRHAALRTSFQLSGGNLIQKVHYAVEFSVEHAAAVEGTGAAASIIQNFIRPFDLSKAPLLRLGVVKLEENRHILIFDMHHIISDGTSLSVFLQELSTLSTGKVLPLLRLQYNDFALWQYERLKTGMLKKQENYWLERFHGEIPVLNMPLDFPRPPVQSFEGDRYHFVLEAAAANELKRLGKEMGTTLFMLLLAIFNIVLARYTGQEDIVIGTTIAGRPHTDLEQMIGLLSETLALRNYPNSELTFAEFLKAVKQSTLEAFENQDYPYKELVKNLGAENELNRTPLFDALLILQNLESTPFVLEGLTFSPYRGQGEEVRYTAGVDLTLQATEFVEGISFRLEYYTRLYKRETMERLARHFLNILTETTAKPTIRLSSLQMIGPDEKTQLLEQFNCKPQESKPYNQVQEIFVTQATKNPDKIALLVRHQSQEENLKKDMPYLPYLSYISYKELNQKSDRLARLLQEKGVQAETIVAIRVEPSIEMIIGLWGILKSAGAYLPIEARYPQERVDYMLKDSGAKILLTTSDLTKESEKVGRWEGEKVLIEEIPGSLKNSTYPLTLLPSYLQSSSNLTHPLTLLPSYLQNSSNPATGNRQSVTSLAYIIYTSGTTGWPKGVVVEHRNLCTYLRAFEQEFLLHEGDTALQQLSYTFDAFVEELYPILLAGGKLVIPGKKVTGDILVLCNFIAKHRVTFITSSPQVLNELNHFPQHLATLRIIISGGDCLKSEYIGNLLKIGKVYNTYGPTESTVCTTYYYCPPEGKLPSNVSIGKPIKGYRVYILDRYGNLLPVGVSGEFCVSGAGVTRGYLNRPELTAEKFGQDLWDDRDCHDKKFLPGNPGREVFIKIAPPDRRQRLYKTGDLARWYSDGNIEFLGRIDRQVKIRGFRIELGEIESWLLRISGVKEAVVLEREEAKDDKYLCAYFVSDREYGISEFREYLAKELPDYMIPTYFVHLEKIPLTSNGKVDRRALPEPELQIVESYLAPRNEIEKKLVEIWSGVLGIEKEKIGINDNFFNLGGHSLKATILGARIHKELNVFVPLPEIFENSDIRGLAAFIKNAKTQRFFTIRSVEKREYYMLSSAQRRLFILQRIDEKGIAYNIPSVWQLEGNLDIEKFSAVFQHLIRRHDSLRTSFHILHDEPVQKINEEVKVEIGVESDRSSLLEGTRGLAPLSLESAPRNPKPVTTLINSFIRPFDLYQAPLFRVGLIEQEEKNILMVDMHHIISDGTSMGILLQEFMELYAGKRLPVLRLQYKDYSEWQHRQRLGKPIEQQEAYWLKEFSMEIPVLELPTDYPRPVVQDFAGSRIHFEIEREETKALKSLTNEQGITLFMLLLSIYTVCLSRLCGQEDIVVGTPIAGRRHADLESIMGMFVNTLALRNFPDGQKPFIHFLEEVKENTVKAFENQDYLYEDLVEKVEIERDTGRNPIFDTMFVLQNIDASKIEFPVLKAYPINYEARMSKFDLVLSAVERAQRLLFTYEYSTKLFKEETLRRFIGYFIKTITTVIHNPGVRISGIEIIGEEEKNRILYEFNDTAADYPKDKTIHRLFEEQVERTPDNIALHGGSKLQNTNYKQSGVLGEDVDAVRPVRPIQLTYRELNDQSGKLAGLLIEKGIQPDTIVGIMIERSVEMIIGILGILKADGAYMPIDQGYPQKRIDYMLKDSKSALLLTASTIDEAMNRSYKTHRYYISPSSLAYIIYTSGSTGKPKGAMIEHHSVINRLNWMQEAYPIGPGDVILQKTPVVFDVSVWELFWWSFCGAGLSLLRPGEEKDPGAIVAALGRYQVTTMHFVPSMLNAFLVYFESLPERERELKQLKSLRQVFSSGEALLVSQVERYYQLFKTGKPPKLINLYGPTEAAVDVSYFQCPYGVKPEKVPIGKPIDNIRLYVLARGLQVQPIGISGELYIAGVGLARGYLNNPGLTAEKFVKKTPGKTRYMLLEGTRGLAPLSGKNHLQSCIHASIPYPHHPITPLPHSPIYRTGDLARWLEDGNIEFLGRIDNQVKIRGFRVELEEIENLLTSSGILPVKEAAAVARPDPTGDNRVIAYIVPDKKKAFTVFRLLELGRQEYPVSDTMYQWPNRMPVYYLNRMETDFMYKEIFEDRSYMKHGISLKEGSCVFDVGANIGVFSLFVHRYCKKARVYSFEPLPPVYRMLTLNTSLYDGDFKTFNYGIGSGEGEAVFTYYPHVTILSGISSDREQTAGIVRAFLSKQEAAFSIDGEKDAAAMEEVYDELLAERLTTVRYTCRIKSLSQVIEENEVGVIDLLKIDVEKAEMEVLAGIKEEHWPLIRQLVIEVHESARKDNVLLPGITQLLENKGYRIAVEQEQLLENTRLYNLYAVRCPGEEIEEPKEPMHELFQYSVEDLVQGTRDYLISKLPGYMVPAHILALARLPLTPSGKIDRKALPEPGIIKGEGFTPPQNEIERKLVEIWSEVLGVAKEKIGIHDNFLHLGGHSLKAIILSSRIQQTFNVHLPLAEIFQQPVIRKLSTYIKEASKDSYQILEMTEKKDYYPLSSAQKRLFFLDRLRGNTTPYNLPAVMRVEGELDRFKLEQVFETLIRRHESLRTSFRVVEGEPVQVIHESWEFDLTYMNIEEESIRRTIDGFIQPFNLDRAPLMRVGLVDFGIGQHLLLFDMHHIISDGISTAILVREFLDAYQEKMLPVLSIQYKDYSQWQNCLLESDGFKKQEEYWLSRFKGELRPLELPTDNLRPSIQGFEGNRLVFHIDSELTEKIKSIVSDLNTTLYTGLLAVYYILLSRYTGQEDIFIGIPTSGRNRVDIEGIIGFFVNTLPVRNYPKGEKPFFSFLEEVKVNVLDAYDHQDYPFDVLVDQLNLSRDYSRNPVFDVLFVSENVDIPRLRMEGLNFVPYKFENRTTHLDLVLYTAEVKDKVTMILEYSTMLFEHSTVEKMTQRYVEILKQVANNKNIRLKDIKIATSLNEVKLEQDFKDFSEFNF